MRWLAAWVLIVVSCRIEAQGQQGNAKTANDLSWAREFASPAKRQMDNKWDPRFRELMRSSFHQRQSFWRDHGVFPTLPELVETFIGVPAGVTLDEDRYLTLDGCVPHACSTRGMVWIDTRGTGKPLVIFVAPEDVSSGPGEKDSLQHLWLYASDVVNWQKMPPDFMTSLAHWYTTYRTIWKPYYSMRVVMLTLVEPTGLTVDLSPSLFSLSAEPDVRLGEADKGMEPNE